MIELSQFNLQLTLVGTRTLGEDIQDQTGTINDPALQFALKIALLAGGQGVIEDDQLAFAGLDQRPQLVDLTATDEKTRGGLVTGNGQETCIFSAGRPYQFDKFLRIFLALLVQTFEVNKNRTFTPFMALKKQSGLLHHQGLPASASSAPGCVGRRTGRPGTTVEIACL